MTFLVDSFTDANGTLLQNHTPDTGSGWTALGWRFADGTAASPDAAIQSNVLIGPFGGRGYRNATTPGSAEYDVDLGRVNFLGSNLNSQHTSAIVAARMSPTGTAHGDVDYYMAGWHGNTGWREWQIRKSVSGTVTSLSGGGSAAQNTNYALKFEVTDAAKRLLVNTVEQASTTDNAITQVGVVGLNNAGSANTEMDDLSAEAVGAPPTFDPANLGVVIDGTTAQLSHDPSPIFT